MCDDGGGLSGSRALWFLHELDGKSAGEGFEYHLVAIGMAIVLLLKGGGAHSVDQKLAKLK